MKSRIQEKFKALFGEEGVMYASAGRINLIGEHTDYNGGYVFPGAINFGIMTAIKPNGTNKVKVYSLDYTAKQQYEFDTIVENHVVIPKGTRFAQMEICGGECELKEVDRINRDIDRGGGFGHTGA